MINKDRYIETAKSISLPISMEPWWMEATSKGKHWEGIVVEENGQIIGMMALHWTEKLSIKMASTPLLTPMTPIWIDLLGLTQEEATERERKVVEEIAQDIENLKIDILLIKTGIGQDPTLFNRCGLKTKDRHTYIVDDISSPANLLGQYHKMKRRYIQKAIGAGYELKENVISPEEYYDTYERIIEERGEKVAYRKEYFTSIAHAAISHEQGVIFTLSKPEEDKAETAMLCVWDERSAYAIAYWTKSDAKNTGSSSLIFHRAIEAMSRKTKSFDFEGGMDKNVGNSYSKFATKEVGYVMVEKTYSLRGKILNMCVAQIEN